MKVRVVKQLPNGYPLFTVQRKFLGIWFSAFYMDRFFDIHYFKSGISPEVALDKFTKRYGKEKQVVIPETIIN